MHSTGSFLFSVIERVRGYLDEPSSKYSNDFLVRNVIMPEMVNVLSRLSLNFDNPVVVRHAISLVSGTEYYQLPPNVGEIFRLVQMNSDNIITADYKPEGQFHPSGPNWSLEGNLLSVRPKPDKNLSLHLFYIPNGDFLPHYNQGNGQLSADRKTLTLCLPSQVAVGAIDRRPNSYVGATLRLLKNTAGNATVVEERVIDSHTLAATDAGDDQVTVRVAFDTSAYGSKTDIHYEIVPQGFQSLMQAVSAAAAINLGVMKDVSAKKMQFLQLEYRKALKTIGDNLSYMQMRSPKKFQKNTVDNQDRHIYSLGME
tara:strand:+ start:6253 stop:7191 length:939 start_codon:yes stop_codon:yes gene_type:complete